MHILGMSQFPDRASLEKMLSECEKYIPLAEAKGTDNPVEGNVQHLFVEGNVHHLFFEPSTRTRISFRVAADFLGLNSIEVSGPEATSLMKDESLSDTAMTHAKLGADVIVIRTPFEGGPQFVAEHLQRAGMEVTIINGGDGQHEHPTQCQLDLLTIKSKYGRLDDFTIGMIGDLKYGRTTHSLIQALSRFDDIRVVLISQPEARMPDQYKKGVNILYEGADSSELRHCDLVYVTRPQLERIRDPLERERLRRAYCITPKVLSQMKPRVKVMHPLPCVDEIDPRIKLDSRFIAFDQITFGVPVRMNDLEQAFERYEPLELTYPFDPVERTEDTKADVSKKMDKYFRPIGPNEKGVVIDHIPVQKLELVRSILEFFDCFEDGIEMDARNVDSAKVPGGIKSVLLLRNQTIPPYIGAMISYVLPTVTFNVFPGNERRLKTYYRIPPIIQYFKCGNPSCITNNDTNAEINSIFHILEDGSKLQCHYCQRIFSKEEIIH